MIMMMFLINLTAFALWMALLRRLTRPSETGGLNKAPLGFFFLGLLSIPLTFKLYDLLEASQAELYLFAFTGFGYHLLNHFFFTGPIEELAKFLVFFVSAWLFRTVREPRDGVIQAAGVALAFGVVENFYYITWYESWFVALYRPLFCILSHMTYSLAWGLTAGHILSRREKHLQGQGADYLNLRKALDRLQDPNPRNPARFRIPRNDLKALGAALVIAAFLHGLSNTLLLLISSHASLAADILLCGTGLGLYFFFRRRSPYNPLPAGVTERRALQKRFREIRQALQAAPHSAELHLQLGRLHLKTGDLLEAQAAFDRAYQHHRQRREFLVLSAACDFFQGDTLRGEARLREAHRRMDPDAFRRWGRRAAAATPYHPASDTLAAAVESIAAEPVQIFFQSLPAPFTKGTEPAQNTP